MARLTNRPSVAYSAASRYPSATPTDPAFDQENMDPARPRDKGKERADQPPAQARLPTPQSRDEASPTRGQKRKRVTVPRPTLEDESVNDDSRFTRYYDPQQDPEERREVKRHTRELVEGFHDKREELLREDNGTRLREILHDADNAFKQVKQTSDAIPDSRLLVSVGELAYKKSAALTSGNSELGLDVDEFFAKCLSFMRNGGSGTSQRQPANTQTEDSDNDDDDDRRPLDWAMLGRHACYPHNTRPPVPSFLLGPLSREKKQRAQTQRRPRQQNTAEEARPEALTQADIHQNEQNSVTAQCTALRKGLKRHIRAANDAIAEAGVTQEVWEEGGGRELLTQHDLTMVETGPGKTRVGVPFLKYVCNPRSFGQTVENIFYVSFLIKEGSIGLELDQDGLPVLFPSTSRTVEEQKQDPRQKQQAVLSIDYDIWRQVIEAYNITEPMMAHREESQATQPGPNGWYGS